MEPVFMVLGQSAAVAAVLAITKQTTVQGVDVSIIQELLKKDPLVDGTTPEILVDNSDSANVELIGSWSLKKGGTYGPSAYYSTVNDKPKAVKFMPAIRKSGYYDLYTFVLPAISKASTATSFMLFDGNKEKEVVIKLADVKIKGQTSGEWVYLGRQTLTAGAKPWIVVSDKGADGVIVADAVLWIPVQKNTPTPVKK
jgi:hypothetical protein